MEKTPPYRSVDRALKIRMDKVFLGHTVRDYTYYKICRTEYYLWSIVKGILGYRERERGGGRKRTP